LSLVILAVLLVSIVGDNQFSTDHLCPASGLNKGYLNFLKIETSLPCKFNLDWMLNHSSASGTIYDIKKVSKENSP
jgi:hypothetical protein